METLVQSLAIGMASSLLKAQCHSQKTVELTDHLMMTNQKLQAGSVLMDVQGPQGVPEEPTICEFAMVHSSMLVETHWGVVPDSEVESKNRQQLRHWHWYMTPRNVLRAGPGI